MKKKHLQKQILAAMLTGVIVVNTCPIVAMATETMSPETEMVQEATEETTATEAAEIPETPGTDTGHHGPSTGFPGDATGNRPCRPPLHGAHPLSGKATHPHASRHCRRCGGPA